MGTLKKLYNRVTAPSVEYQPLIEVRIFKDALLHNLKEYQKKYSELKFAPVLKSNAYGHGLVEVAEILENQKLPFFMVDSFYEALTLRQARIKTRILILGYSRSKQLLKPLIKNCAFGITSLEQLEIISSALTEPREFHLKIDTGMHRQGVPLNYVSQAISLIKSNKNIILEGVCSHFADSENKDESFTDNQIQEWNKVAATFKEKFPQIKYFHVANTGGFYHSKKIQANVGRLGIGLYGINTAAINELQLQPALEMVSIISSIKNIGAGDKVGYSLTYESEGLKRIATVPVGYNEGVDRRLSNSGSFKIGNDFCPILGRVSMNITTIDVTAVPGVKLEQEVIVLSRDPKDKNCVFNIAQTCNCLEREILVHIPQSLRRVIM